MPHIGLIAQEVEQTNPDAVKTHPSGYKMVDYGRATELASALSRFTDNESNVVAFPEGARE